MRAPFFPLVIEKGSDFDLRFTLLDDSNNPIDLTGHIVRSQIRSSYGEDAQLLATFTTINTLGADGVVHFRLSSSVTASLPAGKAVYDVEWEDNTGYVSKILRGVVIVHPEATR